MINGKTAEVPAMSYIALGIAGCALYFTEPSPLGNKGSFDAPDPKPGFGAVPGYFQSVNMNGMISFQYPPVYRGFPGILLFLGASYHATRCRLQSTTSGS